MTNPSTSATSTKIITGVAAMSEISKTNGANTRGGLLLVN